MSEKDKHKTFVWEYFDRAIGKGISDEAKCKKCAAIIKCTGGSTSGLLRHLKSKHSIEKPSPTQSADSSETQSGSSSKRFKSACSQPTLQSFMKKNTREEMVAKLIALDGFPPSAVSKSEFIRQAFSDKGMLLPKNPTHVMQLVYKQYEITKDVVMMEMQRSLKSGKRFSLSLDEYSSLQNKRYLNINVHEDKDKFWNLGMVAISGRMTAEKTIEEVENKLSEFSLSLSRHIVAVATDGASVMVKFGRCVDCEHQLCYAHAIHLAVCDVLYKKQAFHETNVTEVESSAETDAEELEEDDCQETEDLRSGINIEHGQNEEQAASHIRSDLVSNAVNVATAIDKVRKIARIIRKSPVKNDTLQSYVKSENRESTHLLLDCKTRWNSLVAMLERFLDLRSPVEKNID